MKGNTFGIKNKGIKFSEERKKKIGLSNSKSQLGKILSEETKRKIGETSKQHWKNEEYAIKVIKNTLKGLIKRPTSFEKKIIDLIKIKNLPFKYVGDGSFLIGRKNPDFINEKDKIAIEVYYSYYKIKVFGSVNNYKNERISKYNDAGWKVIFIDENDLKGLNYKDVCLNKILRDNNEQ